MAPITIFAAHSHETLFIYDCWAMFPTIHNTFPLLIHYVNPTDRPFTDFHADSSYYYGIVATVWVCQFSIVTLFKRKSRKVLDTFLLCFILLFFHTKYHANFLRWKPYSAFSRGLLPGQTRGSRLSITSCKHCFGLKIKQAKNRTTCFAKLLKNTLMGYIQTVQSTHVLCK